MSSGSRVLGFLLMVLVSRAVAPLAQTVSNPRSPAPPALTVVTPARPCADLATVDITDVGGAGSRIVSAGETVENAIDLCVVEGVLAPSIGFKLTLPTKTWTQRYLQVGCGGLCGRISLQPGAAEGCVPLQAGAFAIASTDMGHQGMGGDFGRDPQKREDFAHRGVHATAVAARKLIRVFYGRSEAFAYFTGCSDGGREGLMEAQRYPDDFDGIIAGAPAMNFQVQNSLYHSWQARSNQGADGKPVLVADRLPVLHKAVVERCDALDGQRDGLITDPRRCTFDPGTIACSPGQTDASACLAPAEVETARRLYQGPRDPQTGERLTNGGPQPGSELSWAGVFVPRSATESIFSERIALDAMRSLIFETNPPADFRLADVSFDRAFFDRLRPLHPLYDATNPDLSAFAASRGKLILWHGWSDPHISPINTIAYHDALGALLGDARRSSFERLFLLPGMYHCSNGEGPSRIDLLTPMLAWVEQGIAPEAIIARAASPDGGSRPVYPYPFVARYAGKGAPDQASSYVRAKGLDPGTPRWAGSDFYQRYQPRETLR